MVSDRQQVLDRPLDAPGPTVRIELRPRLRGLAVRLARLVMTAAGVATT